MKRRILPLALFLSAQGICMNTFAKTFAGAPEDKKHPTLEIQGPVQRIIETDSDFKILVGHYAAFYKFPKNKDQAEVEKLLKARERDKKPLTLTVDPISQTILKLAE